jgi:hypothetical protein
MPQRLAARSYVACSFGSNPPTSDVVQQQDLFFAWNFPTFTDLPYDYYRTGER